MAMDFWGRLDKEIESKSNRKTITDRAGIAPNAVSLWIRRKTYPAADVIVRVANELDTNVEYLVTGKNPDYWYPRAIADIVEDLKIIDDETALDPIRTLAHTAAERARARGGAPPAEVKVSGS